MSDHLWQPYNHLVTHIVPGPKSTSYFIPFVLLPTALCIPPSWLSKWQIASLFFPLITACLFHSWIFMNGVDVISINTIQWSFVLLICYDPRKTFRRIRVRSVPVDQRSVPPSRKVDGKHGDGDTEWQYWEEPYPTLISDRIRWVMTLLPSLRLSNWKTGDAAHDGSQPLSPMSRASFTKQALFVLFQSLVILDITSFLTRHDPYFHFQQGIPSTSVDDPWPLPALYPSSTPLSLLSWISPRIIRSMIVGSQAYALITQGGSIPCLPVIYLNYLGLWPDEWSPHTWPPFFGLFSAVWEYGLRGLWGRWWHQTNRYLATPGKAFAEKVLGLETKGMGVWACGVVSAFAGSGIMHMGLVPPEPRDTDMGAMDMRWRVAGFFWMQALGLWVEFPAEKTLSLLLHGIGSLHAGEEGLKGPRMSGLGRRLREVLTFTWVIVWLSFTIPILVEPFKQLGYWKYPPLPISAVGYLEGRGWWMWP